MSQLTRSFVLLLFVSMPALAQRNAWPYHDPDLIEKLYQGDYAHIGNDNASRQDLIATIAAFGLPADPEKKCAFVTDDSLAGGAKLAGYVSFLQSDSRTGQYPSAEAGELAFLSALYPDPPYVYINDPNLIAMATEIDTHKCNSERIQTIRRNFVKLLDDRMAGRNIPASAVAPSSAPGIPQSRPGAAPTQSGVSPQQAAQQQADAAAAAQRQAEAAAAAQRQAEAAAAQREAEAAAAAERARAQAERAQQAQQATAKAQECSQRLLADQSAGRPQQELQQAYLACVQQVQQISAPPSSAAAEHAQQVQDRIAKAQECMQRLLADQTAGRPDATPVYMTCVQKIQPEPATR